MQIIQKEVPISPIIEEITQNESEAIFDDWTNPDYQITKSVDDKKSNELIIQTESDNDDDLLDLIISQQDEVEKPKEKLKEIEVITIEDDEDERKKFDEFQNQIENQKMFYLFTRVNSYDEAKKLENKISKRM
eukprot:gene5915-9745_t